VRTLTPTLLAAQKEPSAVPFVKVTQRDRNSGVTRLRWERLYTVSEPDRYHAAVMPGDGSLLRARVDASGPTLYYQRVASPGPGAAFGSWTDLGDVADAGVALAASGANVLLAYVAPNGIHIRIRESSDYGATLGSVQTPVGATAAVGWLAAALKGDGTAVLFYSAGGVVYTAKRVSGSWGSSVAWPYVASQITGLAVTRPGDYDLAIAGVDTGGIARLWTATYGDGFGQTVDTWSALREVAKADSGSNVVLRAPSLGALDTYRLFFVEEYAGSVAYSRPYWTWSSPGQTFAENAWREPVPFDLSSSYGVALAGSSAKAWLSTPSGVWRSPLETPELDVSDDILELATETRPMSGRTRVVLRNDDGRYNALPSVVRPGAELAVSPGYVTNVGVEVSVGPRYWVEGWEYASSGGEATLTLLAGGPWSLVEAWRARRQYVWSAGSESVSQVLRFVFGRAGVELGDVGASSTATGHRPAFTIHPGEDGLRAVQRLLALTPDTVLVSGATALLFEPLAGDTAVSAYGTDHSILRARFASAGLAANRVQVFGQGVLAEGFDWDDIGDHFDGLRQVHDLNLSSTSLATARATASLRQEELSLARGELVAPVHCGLELYDVVSVTDARAGVAGAHFRVAGLDLRYVRRARSPVYEQRVLLGSV
jgi:hypothetical protein